MKVEVTDGMKYTLQDIMGYLSMRGIPRKMINQIRMHLTYDAVTQSDAIKYDRFMTAAGLMLREEFGFGQKRIHRALKHLDDILVCVSDDTDNERAWPKVMEKLRDEVGIIIRSGDDNRLVMEILTDEEMANYKYGRKSE